MSVRRGYWLGIIPSLLLFLGIARFPVTSAPANQISDAEFQNISLRLSERSGFFGTDNLVSNETSFLHVKQDIEDFAEPGKAYVGVGPDQNFTYIAASQPSIAFIIDIRRDNLIHHLYYKGLFLNARNRWQYLSLLFGRRLDSVKQERKASAAELVRELNRVPRDQEFFEGNFDRIFRQLQERFPKLLVEIDRAKMYSIASTFFEDGFDVRYEIPGRPMLTFFPSFGHLMQETDLKGKMGHYLNSETDFQILKELQETNRIIPVVGNFGGPSALKGIGDEIRSRGLTVSVFYLSNVEFYLFRNGIFRRFVDNVSNLPIDDKSLFIRSYFNNWFGTWRTHPNAVHNYFSTSLAQRIQRFLELDEKHEYENYWDLVTRDYLGAPARPSQVLP